MSTMYSDGVVILDLDYLVAAQLLSGEGQWVIIVHLGLGSEGVTHTLLYPSQSEAERAFLGMRARLEAGQ